MKKIMIVILLAFLQNMAGNAQPLKPLPLNGIKPQGWIKNQMLKDLSEGYFSVYDSIQPNLEITHFGPDKVSTLTEDSTQNWIARRDQWWSSCHQAYFSEGLVRNAYFTGYRPGIEKIEAIFEYVIRNQEESGYIGIYDENSRLDKQPTGNGELLVQSLMHMALLAGYEFTGNPEYLEAVRKAVNYTIFRFENSGKSYFGHENPQGGGLSHGLIFIDVLEWLYRITNDERYVRFGFWLYDDFNRARSTLTNIDVSLESLLDRDLLFQEHAVHVVEHFRTPFWLSTLTKDPEYKRAVENIFYKLELQTTPTGAIVTDPRIHESVAGNYGSPDLPYEYCTLTELAFSYASAIQKFNITELAGNLESLVFNAGQGARFPDGRAIKYLTYDNQFEAVGSSDNATFRYQYGACHRVACCNLEAAKLMPYYVGNMWMKSLDEKSIYALLYGPSEVNTRISNIPVTLKQVTDYPFENRVVIRVFPEKPTEFSLYLRNPEWSESTFINATGAEICDEGGYYKVTKKWRENDLIEIEFSAPVTVRRFLNNELYVKKGAIIYAIKVDEHKEETKLFDGGFANYNTTPSDKSQAKVVFESLRMPDNIDIHVLTKPEMFTYQKSPKADRNYPFDVPYGTITGDFYNGARLEKWEMVPIGSTILRKVTFKERSK